MSVGGHGSTGEPVVQRDPMRAGGGRHEKEEREGDPHRLGEDSDPRTGLTPRGREGARRDSGEGWRGDVPPTGAIVVVLRLLLLDADEDDEAWRLFGNDANEARVAFLGAAGQWPHGSARLAGDTRASDARELASPAIAIHNFVEHRH